MKYIISLLLIAITLSSVSQLYATSVPKLVANQTITHSNLSKISSDLKETASDEIIELFISAITRLGNTPDSILGKTVTQLIEEQKKHNREELEKTLIKAGARIELFLNHKFHYHGIQFLDEDTNKPMNNLIFDITNISDKGIKKIAGNLSFYSQQGHLVRVFQIVIDDPIPAEKGGKTLTFGQAFLHDTQTADILIRTSGQDMQTIWTPKLIEFVDGTKIEDITSED